MNNPEDLLDKAVVAVTLQGSPHAAGRVIGYAAHPTFTIEMPNGERFSWAASLVKPAMPDCPDCLGIGYSLPKMTGDTRRDMRAIAGRLPACARCAEQ